MDDGRIHEADDIPVNNEKLTLPPAFGSAYVGETFSCSLCANNEITGESPDPPRTISSVRIVAEMQTPSQSVPLNLSPPGDGVGPQSDGLGEGESIQKIVRFDLKEEGNHVLAVNVSYTETTVMAPKDGTLSTTTTGSSGQVASGGRVRTFRKLYQFIAQPCLSVRTKASELPPTEVENKSLGPYGKSRLLRFALEAQLENVGDGVIVLEGTTLNPKSPFKSKSLNWDFERPDSVKPNCPALNPRDVLQVAFLLEQANGEQEGLETLQKDMKRDGRTVLGQLSIEWRSAMGDRGFLSTGNLLTKKR
ncbi:hypothetical protein FQN54_007268 [Arachnomyces sp. PD_36]|nr:hypothetical protein FQN54_007268 [Arachnomyces sp. PD_36]